MFLRYNFLSITWALIILILTLIPGKSIPEVGITDIDKLVHAIIFGILLLLFYNWFAQQHSFELLKTHPLIFSSVFSFSYGFLIEILQNFVPGRTFSAYDVLANSIGVALGSAAILLAKNQQIKK